MKRNEYISSVPHTQAAHLRIYWINNSKLSDTYFRNEMSAVRFDPNRLRSEPLAEIIIFTKEN